MLSPDGNWLAYESTHTGTTEVYVRPYPGLDRERGISNGGGHRPIWAQDGSLLFYRFGEQMMVVPIELGEPAGSPTPMFERSYYGFGARGWPGGERQYDVVGDGQFLMNRPPSPPAAPPPVHVVLNWFEALRERVPVP